MMIVRSYNRGLHLHFLNIVELINHYVKLCSFYFPFLHIQLPSTRKSLEIVAMHILIFLNLFIKKYYRRKLNLIQYNEAAMIIT